MAFCRLHGEYWAVNLESLGLDTLSNTETSKPCIISKHGLVVHKFNICHKSLSGLPFWTGNMGRMPVTQTDQRPRAGGQQAHSYSEGLKAK